MRLRSPSSLQDAITEDTLDWQLREVGCISDYSDESEQVILSPLSPSFPTGKMQHD